MASISLFEYRVSGESCQVFLGLPFSGSTAWNSLSRACFAEPPAESPSTMNSSFRSGSSEAQSVSLPGSTATPELLRRSTFCAARMRVVAWRITSSAMLLPSSTCWLSQVERVAHHLRHELDPVARYQLVLHLALEL